MGQIHDIENQAGMVQNDSESGATGGQASPAPVIPLPPVEPPGNVNIVNEYNSFNLANVTVPITPKWKTSDTFLDEYRKFKQSCQRNFDDPMYHITSVKVKTNMFIIWAGADGENIYDSFNLPPAQRYNIELVMQRFEEFCEPICNFHMARFKFAKVHQNSGEPVDTFYNRILKIACQCKFTDMDERIIDTIIYGTTCVKSQDKLLQMPKTLTLQQ